jgi:hypothetical protein
MYVFWGFADIAIAVLSGVNNTVVTTFDAQSGHQLFQSPLLSGSPLGLEILSPDWPGENTRDLVTLSSDGNIRRFHKDKVVWETTSSEYDPSFLTHSSIKGSPHFIATSLSKIFVVYLVPHGRTYSIAVATLDSVTGDILDTTQLSGSVTSAEDIQVVGSHSSAPLVVWHEYTTTRTKGTLKANILGSKSVTQLSTEHEFTTFSVLAPHSSTSLPHFLVSFNTPQSSSAQVYHINLATGTITTAYSLPKGPKGPYSLAQVDANTFFGKVTVEKGRQQADFEVWGSNSHGRLGQWTIPFPTAQYGIAGFVHPAPTHNPHISVVPVINDRACWMLFRATTRVLQPES